VERIRPYVELGFRHLVFHAPGPDQAKFLRLYSEQVIPKLRAAFELAREGGLAVEVRPVPREEALHADEMWLSSSTKEILAVTKVDGQAFAVGLPGPLFRKMYALLSQNPLGLSSLILLS